MVTPDTSIGEVAQKLIEYRIGGVPVIEHGQIDGVITESDLFRVIVAAYQAAQSAPSQAEGIRERLLGDNH